jgi:hypothetical protein
MILISNSIANNKVEEHRNFVTTDSFLALVFAIEQAVLTESPVTKCGTDVGCKQTGMLDAIANFCWSSVEAAALVSICVMAVN